MSKKLIVILALVAVAGGAGTGAFLALSKDPPPAEEGAASPSKPKIDPEEPAGLLELDTFLANINYGEGERFAKLQVRLAVVPESEVAKLQEDTLLMARIRDRILTLLTSKSYDELSDPLGKEGFRSEIRMRVEPLLEEGEIREVLFSDFVVQ